MQKLLDLGIIVPGLLFYIIGKIDFVKNKAKESCKNSDINVFDHFVDVNKMVQIGSGAYREQIDYKSI